MPRTAPTARAALLVLIGLSGWGCAAQPVARYVYQDNQFGVIAIPQNTSLGRNDYLAQAHALMTRHFPEGYEIVRAEEVVEGQRFLDAGRKTELSTEPALNLLDQMIKLGKIDTTKSIEQKDTLPILESRIIYRRAGLGEPLGSNGFASRNSAKLEFYLDPNDMIRCKHQQMLAEANHATADPKVSQAGAAGSLSVTADAQVLKSKQAPPSPNPPVSP